MLAALLSLALVSQSEGSTLYLARIGENAVIRRASIGVEPGGKGTPETCGVFADVADLVAFEAARSKLVEANLGNRAKLNEVLGKLQADYRDSKKIVPLKSLTPVEVLGYASFNAAYEKAMRPRTNTTYSPNPSCYLVRVKEGPLKGKLVWASRFDVVVPGSKAPQLPKPVVPEEDEEESEEPRGRPRESRPVDHPLALVDTSWGPYITDDYMRVQGRVRNSSDKPISRLRVTVDIEDARDKLAKSEWTFLKPDTLEPGDVGNFEVTTKKEDSFDHYVVRFEADGRNVEYSRPK
jgi:hypothetical protein